MKRKSVLVALIAAAMLLISACANDNDHEKINIDSRENLIFDDININLESGYWVKDYTIDYDNKLVILNLTKDGEKD